MDKTRPEEHKSDKKDRLSLVRRIVWKVLKIFLSAIVNATDAE